jgi:hypothetical protein
MASEPLEYRLHSQRKRAGAPTRFILDRSRSNPHGASPTHSSNLHRERLVLVLYLEHPAKQLGFAFSERGASDTALRLERSRALALWRARAALLPRPAPTPSPAGVFSLGEPQPFAKLRCRFSEFSDRRKTGFQTWAAIVLQENAIHGRLHTASAHRDRQKYP